LASPVLCQLLPFCGPNILYSSLQAAAAVVVVVVVVARCVLLLMHHDLDRP